MCTKQISAQVSERTNQDNDQANQNSDTVPICLFLEHTEIPENPPIRITNYS